MRRIILSTVFLLALHGVAGAGPIAIENARPGHAGWDLQPSRLGNAQASGVIDLYPAAWSIARGETVRLKVRATASYSVQVYRLGWYDGAGARRVLELADRPADPQPYPTGTDPATGLAAAKWHDSVSFATDSGWAPGLYVARADHASGAQAMTFFVVRDDGLTTRMPILVSVTTATHQAYNAWPGASRGGKSLYGFNSSASIPTESGSNQAVAVSFDRPFLVGGGAADLVRYEVPFLRWAERNGWDVAWCTDEDLARDGKLVSGRRVLAVSGHWEYLSRPAYDTVEAARDAGVNLLVMSGDTLAWAVRLEDGGRTMVSYKENWKRDPVLALGLDAAASGDKAAAREHLGSVTRGWKKMGYHPELGIDLRRPAMRLLGVQSAGAMNPSGPWGSLRIEASDHWLFEGTGLGKGDTIEDVMGYEFDNFTDVDGDFSSFVPPGRIKLGVIHRRSGDPVGGAAYHRAASGAEVVALGATNFAYALDGYSAAWKGAEQASAQRMIDNALRRWTAGAPTPSVGEPPAGELPSDAAVSSDAAVASDAAVSSDATVPSDATPPSDAVDSGLYEDVSSAGFDASITTVLPPPPAADPIEETANGSACAHAPPRAGGAWAALLALAWALTARGRARSASSSQSSCSRRSSSSRSARPRCRR